ncbi:protein extra-macrochaetae [Phlebotomus argentipes]|uniref:protein extra-macrochaetae n=1 Tax=Phlebotomus argentipes TaxID=94469 RepID=UPI002892EF6C|nr:protein extra-macrochaetae [Phlebotomus argentipes]
MKMKAITAVCSTGASVPGISGGRVARHRDGENAEIQMYLSKLKDLVPFMPKNRKLSKLEVIQHVIDYICDLQSALEMHPAVNTFDAAAALNQPTAKHSTPVSPRQPLGVRPSPNTILTTGTNPAASESHHQVSSSAAITTTSEKSVSSDRLDLC